MVLWAVRNGHETLMAAAVVATDTCAVAARSMPANGRARAGEQWPWMVCFVCTVALACETHGFQLKVHRTFERLELFTPGLDGYTTMSCGRVPVKEPKSGADECARSMYLRGRRPSGTFSFKPFINV